MIEFFDLKELKIKDIICIIFTAILLFFLLISSFYIATSNTAVSSFFKKSDYIHFRDESLLIIKGNKDQLFDKSLYKKLLIDKSIKTNYRQIYTPVFYYFFIPFSILPFRIGVIITTFFYIILYLSSIILLIKTFKRLFKFRFLILLFSLVYIPFMIIIFIGQISVIWLFILSFSFYLAKKDKAFFAGFVLSFLIMKPSFYIIVFIILLISFRPRLFLGIFTGTALLVLITGIPDKFYLWFKWFNINKLLTNIIFNKEIMTLIRDTSIRKFFYPLTNKGIIRSYIDYIFILLGLGALVPPILYSYFNKKHFSRNSFWVIVTIALVLANPYIYTYDLVILILPLIIFFNLLLADRVQTNYIIIILAAFFLWVTIIYVISMFILIQIFALILWFFLINGMLRIRVRRYTPKKFIGYWEDY